MQTISKTVKQEDPADNAAASTDPIKELKDLVYYGKEEVVLAADVSHRLLSLAKISPDDPPPLLGCTLAPAKAQIPPIALISAAELVLSWKLEQLKTAAEFLSAQHSSMSTTLEQENLFYGDFCMRLFSHNWFLQKQGAGKGLFVDYSYTNAGSSFHEIGLAELVRDGEASARLVLPHSRRRRVSLQRIPVDGTRGIGSAKQPPVTTDKTLDDPVIQQLRDAQATIFENELFSVVCRSLLA